MQMPDDRCLISIAANKEFLTPWQPQTPIEIKARILRATSSRHFLRVGNNQIVLA